LKENQDYIYCSVDNEEVKVNKKYKDRVINLMN